MTGRFWRALARSPKATAGAILLAAFIVLALFPGLFAHDSPTAEAYARNLGPSAAHLFGTTGLGQDIFAQAVYGTRPVLLIAFGAGLASTVIAALIGVAAAYLGGFWDGVLNLFTDVVLVIPLFPLLIVIAAYVHNSGTLVLIAVLTFTGWSYTARQLRSQALSLRGRDFLAAARVRGERAAYIIAVEILPTMSLAARRGVPHQRALRRAVRLQPAVHRPRRPELGRLGHHALLGAEQRGTADRLLPAGDRAWRGHRAPRRGVRAAQLRIRRGRQPGAASRARAQTRLARRHPKDPEARSVNPFPPDVSGQPDPRMKGRTKKIHA